MAATEKPGGGRTLNRRSDCSIAQIRLRYRPPSIGRRYDRRGRYTLGRNA